MTVIITRNGYPTPPPKLLLLMTHEELWKMFKIEYGRVRFEFLTEVKISVLFSWFWRRVDSIPKGGIDVRVHTEH